MKNNVMKCDVDNADDELSMKWVGGNTIQREAPVPTHWIQYFPKASFLSSGHLGKCLRHADEMMNSNKGAAQAIISEYTVLTFEK